MKTSIFLLIFILGQVQGDEIKNLDPELDINHPFDANTAEDHESGSDQGSSDGGDDQEAPLAYRPVLPEITWPGREITKEEAALIALTVCLWTFKFYDMHRRGDLKKFIQQTKDLISVMIRARISSDDLSVQ